MSEVSQVANAKGEKRPHETQLFVQVESYQWPIIYTPEYNIGFMGLERLHPFDAGKWGRVHEFLKEGKMVFDHTTVKPLEASTADLMVVHSKTYIDSLKWSINVAGITEVPPVALLPNFIVQRKVLKPFRFQTGGTILAAQLAIERGWAINIGGGFHHCSKDRGGGFCAYADITLAIKFQMERNPNIKKAMIIDLDAHQGNGHERDFMDDESVYILDVYNRGIYPHDGYAKRGIKRKVELSFYTEDEEYLELVRTHVEGALNEFTPDLVVYNAGTDILDGDPLGCLSISPKGIIERDQIVFDKVRSRKIPIMMVTSGGYQRTTARIIADSILNLRALQLIECDEAENAPPEDPQSPVQSPTVPTADSSMKRSSSEGTSLWAKFKRAGACISFPRSQTVVDKLSNMSEVGEGEVSGVQGQNQSPLGDQVSEEVKGLDREAKENRENQNAGTERGCCGEPVLPRNVDNSNLETEALDMGGIKLGAGEGSDDEEGAVLGEDRVSLTEAMQKTTVGEMDRQEVPPGTNLEPS